MGEVHRQRTCFGTDIPSSQDNYAKGNVRALARLVKLNAQALWEYIRGTEVPNFDSLLRLCSALSITPLEFLATKTLPDQRIPQFVVDNLPVVSPRKRKPVSVDDVKRMRQVLEAVIAEERDPPSNLLEVANSIGYNVSTIRRHCPTSAKRFRRDPIDSGSRMIINE